MIGQNIESIKFLEQLIHTQNKKAIEELEFHDAAYKLVVLGLQGRQEIADKCQMILEENNEFATWLINNDGNVEDYNSSYIKGRLDSYEEVMEILEDFFEKLGKL